MKRVRILFLLFAAVSSGIGLLWAASPERTGLYYEVKLKSASFGNMGTRRMWIKKDCMRWELDSAKLVLRIIKNSDGVFLVHPWNKVAAKYPRESNRGEPRVLFPGPTGKPSVFLAAVKAVKQKREKVGGELCDVHSYTVPKTGRKCRIWISVGSGKPVKLVLRGEQHDADTVTATYVKFDLNARMADSRFDLPRGYAVRPMPARRATFLERAVGQSNKGKSG